MTDRDINQPLTPRAARLVWYGTASDWGIRIENPREVARRIGPTVLAAFYKCFIGVDRLITLEHLMYISQIEHAERNGGRDTPWAERDMQLLVFLLAGTLYELGEAIEDLATPEFVQLVQGCSAWQPIRRFKEEWRDNQRIQSNQANEGNQFASYARNIRNGYSHHLGRRSRFIQGIEASPDEVSLVRGSTTRRYGARFVEPWDALMRGDQLLGDIVNSEFTINSDKTTIFAEFVKKTQEGHSSLPDDITELFREVLVMAGIETVDERAM